MAAVRRQSLLMLLLLTLLMLLLATRPGSCGGGESSLRIDASFNTTYTYNVSRSQDYVFVFTYADFADNIQAVRLSIVSEAADLDFPVLVVARQQREIVSWRLPLFYASEDKEYPYYVVSRTLCPTISLSRHYAGASGRNQTIYVEVTTQNVNLTAFALNATIVPNFRIGLGTQHGVSVHVSPSQPKYYMFNFPPNVTSVQVRMASEDMLCMRVSVQAVNCPVYDLARNVEFTGIRQTASKKASLSVTTNDPALASASAFYVVLVVYPSDENCRPNIPAQMVPPNPGQHGHELYRRTKLLNLTVVPALGINEYFLPVFGTILVFLLFYISAFVIALLHHTYETRLMLRGASAAPGAGVCDRQVDAAASPPVDALERLEDNNDDDENADNGAGTNDEGEEEADVHPASPLRAAAAAGGAAASESFRRRNYESVGETPLRVSTSEAAAPSTRPKSAMAGGSATGAGMLQQGSLSLAESASSSASSRPTALTTCDDLQRQLSSAAATTATTISGGGDDCGFVDLSVEANQEKEIFRLRKDMTVHDLTRKPSSRLRKKYKLYYWYLIIISIFYCLPVIQLVLTYQKVLNTSGDEDMCYYNFDCAHTLGVISSFNNVFSNISYVLLGLLFLLLCWRRDLLHQNLVRRDPRASQYGIPHHYGLYYAIGIALIMEGVLSGCYHICPSYNNFQFDTAFMYMLSGLCLLKIYQTRHPDVNASAHMAYMALAIIIFTGLLGVFYSKESTTFYTLFCILVIVTSILLTLEVYYVGRWKMNVGRLKRLYLLVRTDGLSCFRPQRRDRLILLIFANSVNWSLGLYGAFKRPEDFSTFMLSILMVNMMMYFVFYIIMKLRSGERLSFTPVAFTLLDIAAWAGAGYFFLQSPTNWEDSASGSRIRNQPCVLAGFYDVHDVWHFLSAVAMFFGFMIILTMDDDLSYVRRDRIRVF